MCNRSHNKSADLYPYNWARQVWKIAESKWIRRKGQDQVYRNYVAIPGLLDAITQLCDPGQVDIIDLGSGDGYSTNAVVVELYRQHYRIDNIYLLDLSRRQLEIASKQTHLKGSEVIVCDFSSGAWCKKITNSNNRRIYISIFTIQELSRLDVFFNTLKRIIRKIDVCFLLTVDPTFSEILAKKNMIRSISKGACHEDWDWRGLYPIDGETGRFYLPHFQRKTGSLLMQLEKSGLNCVYKKHLKLPSIDEIVSIFSQTVYGFDILQNNSSLILGVQNSHPFGELI